MKTQSWKPHKLETPGVYESFKGGTDHDTCTENGTDVFLRQQRVA